MKIQTLVKKIIQQSGAIPLWEDFLWQRRKNDVDREFSEINDLKTVCFFCGPNRNLASLFGLLIFLHPQGQVLNHAGARVFGKAEFDFWSTSSRKSFEQFCRYITFLSVRGMRGRTGGSILHSNAVACHPEVAAWLKKKKISARKVNVRSLGWKEPLMITKRFLQDPGKLAETLSAFPKMKFLLPVRDPLDCAISNVGLGSAWLKRAYGIPEANIEKMMDVLFGIYGSVLKLQEHFPDRFMALFETEINQDSLTKLAIFLDLKPEISWIEDCLFVWKVSKHYPIKPEWKNYYEGLCRRYFDSRPDILKYFLSFLSQHSMA